MKERVVPPTPRQSEVLGLLAEGLTRPQVADQLGISPHTVSFHVRCLVRRTNSRSLLQAACRLARQPA